jgi:hypothetical protein
MLCVSEICILKLHKEHQGFGKKKHVSCFETTHFKILCGQASKNLASYSIHFEFNQSKAFVFVTANEILLFHQYELRTLQDPAHCISPNRLAKQMDKAK